MSDSSLKSVEFNNLDTHHSIQEKYSEEVNAIFQKRPLTLAEVRDTLNQFRDYRESWDNTNSKAPLPNVIDESLEFLKCWSNESIIPEPKLTDRGSVALRVFDKFGGIKGEIRFVGNCKAAFIVLKNKMLVSSFPFKTRDPEQMSLAEKYFTEYMLTID